jgi:hypothetical protein
MQAVGIEVGDLGLHGGLLAPESRAWIQYTREGGRRR